ncbi:hypothetical protein BDB00DRAFT_806570 [Zychaea mexicana]|uniref:uncharacterized protein n=1 Tax=Zychaea mexicana TaxID=64656 RepID=UPI0022FEA2F4|nr:uncharacterized protein BDB00DRAFT_806570 [Zychaea mexicana]KAI9497051.1 hypothetical protein BDB00DRAFT_806570 [Zychaea mexicana]
MQKCCCCISLRVGVLIIAILDLLASAAAVAYLAIARSDILSYDEATYVNMEAAYYAGLAIGCLAIVTALFGFIGAIAQKRGLVNIFKFVYWIMTLLALIVSFATWIFLIVRREDVVSGCEFYLDNYADQYGYSGTEAADACNKTVTGMLVGGGVGVVVGNIIGIYFACVVSAYASRLKQRVQHHPLRDLEDFPQTSYKTSVY